MGGYSDLLSFVQTCVLLAFLVAVHVTGKETCDKTTCTGPLRYYKDLDCTPVYKHPDDCCAVAYDCSYLKELSRNKCYVNDHEYSIGEELKKKDRNPCDIGCTCTSSNNETARFLCAAADCAFMDPEPNCFYRMSPTQCCRGPYICLEEGEKRATCKVDGKTYLDGEAFRPKSDPDLNCYCMPGYRGKNIMPFCKKPNHPICSPLFRNAGEVHRKCVPVFYENQNPQRDCSYTSICQNKKGVVVHRHESTNSVPGKEHKICLFGNIIMAKGEEFDVSTSYECVHCKCEVPPVPTCQRCDYEHCTH